MILPKIEPLEMVTGEPPNGPAPLAQLIAVMKASSKSVIEPLRLIELPWLGSHMDRQDRHTLGFG